MCIGRQPRAPRPGTRPSLVLCRSRVDYALTRYRSVARHKACELSRDNSNAMAEVGAMNRAERVPALCLARSRCVGLANASAAQYT